MPLRASDRLASVVAAAMTKCKDSSMSEPLRQCAVCHQPRLQGSDVADREFFVCVECENAADQLFAIQDAIWGRPAVDDAES